MGFTGNNLNKILFFKQLFPYPITSGTDANTDSLIRFLSKGNRVHFVSLDDGAITDSDKSRLAAIVDKQTLIRPLNTRSAIARYFFAGLNRVCARALDRPLAAQYLNTPPIDKHLKNIDKSGGYDVGVFAYWNAVHKAGCFKRVRFKIAHLHDANFLDPARRAAASNNLKEQQRLTRLSSKLRRYEQRVLSEFDRIIVQNPEEKKVYDDLLPGKDIRVFPVLVDTNKHKPVPDSEKSNLLLLGNFKHHPNVDSAHYVAREILPLIRRKNSEVRLSIVGHHAVSQLSDLVGAEGVDMIGPVADLQDVFSSHSIFVAPMRVGTGIKIKILEAMAAGMAVVTNSLGAEALSTRSGHDIEVRDTPESIAEVILELTNDIQRRQNLEKAARLFIESNHSAQGVAATINALYRPG